MAKAKKIVSFEARRTELVAAGKEKYLDMQPFYTQKNIFFLPPESRTIEQNGKIKNYCQREEEVLFMDLRQMGSPFEKKYIELTQEDRDKVTEVFHKWQEAGKGKTYSDIPEFCYSATKKEIATVLKEMGYEIKL